MDRPSNVTAMTISDREPMAPFPPLPAELALHILSCACYVSHSTALSVSLVSSWVRSTVLPIVFSTVVRRAGPTMPSTSGWATPQGIRPSAVLATESHRTEHAYSHFLPPANRKGALDVGKLVRHLWIESIDMMSSPGELGIFNACTNVEDVALTASNLRMLYNSTLFGKPRGAAATVKSEPQSAATRLRIPTIVAITPEAASRVHSITLTKHTFRYDWHFLVDISSAAARHASLLANITHLRLTSMEKSAYIPVEYLPGLTHLALPYLHLRSSGNGREDAVRVPQELLRRGGSDDEHTTSTRAAPLKMIVLTINEREWLYKPWRHGAHSQQDSPRALFADLHKRAHSQDDRLHVIISPRMDRDVCYEWAEAARGNTKTVWELAESLSVQRQEFEAYASVLPTVFPPSDLRYASE